jgi:hypothetical protein
VLFGISPGGLERLARKNEEDIVKEIKMTAAIEELKLKKGIPPQIEMKIRCVFGKKLWNDLGELSVEDSVEVQMHVGQGDLFEDGKS